MHRRVLLPLVLTAFVGLTACTPASDVDAQVLSEQAEDYVGSTGTGSGSLGSGDLLPELAERGRRQRDARRDAC